jgi:hypothetical protein
MVVILSFLALAAPATAADPRSYWSVAKLIRAIDGAPIHLRHRVLHVDAETTLCAGRGAPRIVQGTRRWRLFACTYTTFNKQLVDRDLDFRVRVLGPRRFVIDDARWVVGAR